MLQARAAHLLLFILVYGSMVAQKPQPAAYSIQFADTLSCTHEKVVHEAVRDQDPDAEVQVNRMGRVAIARTTQDLDQGLLQEALSTYGAVIVQMGIIGSVPGAERGFSGNNDASSFPDHINTGNATKDDAAYNAAKQAWMNKHGGEFRRNAPPPMDE